MLLCINWQSKGSLFFNENSKTVAKFYISLSKYGCWYFYMYCFIIHDYIILTCLLHTYLLTHTHTYMCIYICPLLYLVINLFLPLDIPVLCCLSSSHKSYVFVIPSSSPICHMLIHDFGCFHTKVAHCMWHAIWKLTCGYIWNNPHRSVMALHQDCTWQSWCNYYCNYYSVPKVSYTSGCLF